MLPPAFTLVSAVVAAPLTACQDPCDSATRHITNEQLLDQEPEAPDQLEHMLGSHPVAVMADDDARQPAQVPASGIEATLNVRRLRDDEAWMRTNEYCYDTFYVAVAVSMEIPTPDGPIVVVPQYETTISADGEFFTLTHPDPPARTDMERLAGVVEGAILPDDPDLEPTLELRLGEGGARRCGGYLAFRSRTDADAELVPLVELTCQ
jgi:hypothetical protein